MARWKNVKNTWIFFEKYLYIFYKKVLWWFLMKRYFYIFITHHNYFLVLFFPSQIYRKNIYIILKIISIYTPLYFYMVIGSENILVKLFYIEWIFNFWPGHIDSFLRGGFYHLHNHLLFFMIFLIFHIFKIFISLPMIFFLLFIHHSST